MEKLPKQIEDTSKEEMAAYEAQVKQNYSEFGRKGLSVNNWGTVIPKYGDRYNLYSSKDHIKQNYTSTVLQWIDNHLKFSGHINIADLGGDDGFLLQEVVHSVTEERSSFNVSGVVVDLDLTGKARKNFLIKKAEGEREGLDFIVADVTRLPFSNESLDILISRMTIQYLDSNQQELFFKEISRVLAENGLLILETAAPCSESLEFNRFMSDITRLLSKGHNFKRNLPELSPFSKFAEFMKKYHLEPIYGSVQDSFPFSVSAFKERFNLDERDTDELSKMFINENRKYPDLFVEIDGVLCLRANLFRTKLIKNSSGHRRMSI